MRRRDSNQALAVALALAATLLALYLAAQVGAQVSDPPITLTRTGPTSARLCAPAGVVWARSGGDIRVAYEAWPGGCAPISAHDTYAGGDIYCVQTSPSPPAWGCTAPLPGWQREYALWLPVIVKSVMP